MKTREEIINELKPHCPTAEEVVCSNGADQQVMYLDDVADLVEKYESRTGFGNFRQECAKAAMQGLLTKNGYSLQPIDAPIALGNFEANKPILDMKAREFAYSAVVYADALIAELRKNN